MLKARRRRPQTGLTTDRFRFACSDLYVHILLLFSALLAHGFAPDECGLNTVISIRKGRKGVLTESSGYRGIALSSVFGKVLDLIILNRYVDFLITSNLQFGFNAKRSTNMCTMVLNEAIDYYTM